MNSIQRQRFRILALIDLCSRECSALHADKRITDEIISFLLDKVKQERGLSLRIKADNNTEFIYKTLDAWAYFNNAQFDYSKPATPTTIHVLNRSTDPSGTNA